MEKRKMIPTCDYFDIWQYPHGVYAISEPYRQTQVTSFLIYGDNQAILLDTGCGIGRMKKQVFSLISTVPIVFNSHCCAYHSGANKKFAITHILNEGHGIDALTHGFRDDWIDAQAKLTEEDHSFQPMTFTTVSNGKQYPLGNKVIEVIGNPHTKRFGCMLADHQNKQLFTGDLFDEACLASLHADERAYYERGLRQICKQFRSYTWFFSTGIPQDEARQQQLLQRYE